LRGWRLGPPQDHGSPMSEYEFDVAFSFHSLDEALAVDLNDRIQDRFKTFIYSEHQKLLAGRDGEEMFNSIFHNRARVVVVFCRKDWGATPFTRIEETAIRNRAFEQGFDFTLFIPADNPPTVPKWLPKTRLYYGLARFGLDGAAAVIEQLIQQFGGDPRIESVADRAARFQRAADFKQDKERFEKSEQGVKAANDAFVDLSNALHDHVATLQKNNSHLTKLKIEQEPKWVLLRGMYPVAFINWDCKFSNSLNDATLSAEFFDGVPTLPGHIPWTQPSTIRDLRFDYQLLRQDLHGYVEREEGGRTFSPEELGDHLMRVFMDISERGGDSN
jgi:hypothetical protein